MFPLGNVLFPHAQLSLHVFEPRYRALAEACLAGDGEFGVVLIERGSEVGGGDTRFSIGTVARIVAAGRLPDGRYPPHAPPPPRRAGAAPTPLWVGPPRRAVPARRGRAARRSRRGPGRPRCAG